MHHYVINVSGKLAVVLCDLHPNKVMTGPEIWNGRKREEALKDKPRTFASSFSCGATYQAIRTGVQYGLIEQVAGEGAGRFRLTERGRTVAEQVAEEMRAAAYQVLGGGAVAM